MSKIATDVEDNTKLRTVAYAMDRLSCGRTTIYKLAKEKRLELVKFDKRSRITDRSLRKLMAEIMKGNAS